jgi:hypothetical protein
VRRKAIQHAMRAWWAGQDADESNWLDEAALAYPGPDAAVRVLYGIAMPLVDRLAVATGEDRQQVLSDVLSWPDPVRSMAAFPRRGRSGYRLKSAVLEVGRVAPDLMPCNLAQIARA